VSTRRARRRGDARGDGRGRGTPEGDGDPAAAQLLLNIALNGSGDAPAGGGTLTFSLGTERQGGRVRADARREHGPPIPQRTRADLRPVLHHEGRGRARALHLFRIADEHEGTLRSGTCRREGSRVLPHLAGCGGDGCPRVNPLRVHSSVTSRNRAGSSAPLRVRRARVPRVVGTWTRGTGRPTSRRLPLRVRADLGPPDVEPDGRPAAVLSRGWAVSGGSRAGVPRPVSPAVNAILWILCEVAIAACDLAEVLGRRSGCSCSSDCR